jgi:hypothetical protein
MRELAFTMKLLKILPKLLIWINIMLMLISIEVVVMIGKTYSYSEFNNIK